MYCCCGPLLHYLFSQYGLRLRELISNSGQSWNSDRLIEIFGFQNCLNIFASVRPPCFQAGDEVLVFRHSTNGQFQVKKAYNMLRSPGSDGGLTTGTKDPVWGLIWSRGEILPRIRLFLWKLVQGALPIGEILTSRRGDPICHSCAKGRRMRLT